jgi:hypothetical protein
MGLRCLADSGMESRFLILIFLLLSFISRATKAKLLVLSEEDQEAEVKSFFSKSMSVELITASSAWM